MEYMARRPLHVVFTESIPGSGLPASGVIIKRKFDEVLRAVDYVGRNCRAFEPGSDGILP